MEPTISIWEQAGIVSFVGFSVVMVCLTLFAIIISGLNKVGAYFAERSKRIATAKQSAAVPVNVDDEELAAVITAAASAFNQPIHIHNISLINNKETYWGTIAKMDNLNSHKINRK